MVDICDFHSHILPKADHGSTSVEQTKKQLQLANRYGISRIIATPHFYPHRDTVESFLERRDSSFKLMRTIELEKMPSVKLAAEVLLCPGMQKLPGIEKLTVSGTRVLLLELPFNDFSREHINTVASLILDGYSVVLAHAERYDSSWIMSLVDIGAVIQLNATAISPLFRGHSVNELLRCGSVVAIGSDIHGADKHAYQHFSKAIRRLGKYSASIQAFSDEVWYSSK